MRPRYYYFLIPVIFSFIITSCQGDVKPPKIDKEAETALVSEAIHNSIGWAKNKDIDLLYGIIANDPGFIEVHPDASVAFGFDEFKQAERFWMDPRFKTIGYKITDLKITLSESGTVAWFYCMLDDMNEWDGRPSNWMNTRWTGVLEKREGKWRTVQQHFSFAVE